MPLPVETAILLVGAGLVAGFVNTVAGGGSVVSIPVLVMAFHGDANLANGTNRVAILLQNVAAVTAFQKGKKVPWRRVLPVLPAVLIGALGGAWLGTVVHPEAMRKVFAFVIVLVAASVLVKPSKWLGGTEARLREPWRTLVFLAAGFYGGFVQAGVGFLLLAGLVLGGGLDLVKGNAAKLVLVLLYTPLALVLFATADKVDLTAGLVLAAGNVGGALLATTLAVKKGAGWIRWVLVVAAAGAAAKMLLS
jgi:uncharacterized membrane protein YfcA